MTIRASLAMVAGLALAFAVACACACAHGDGVWKAPPASTRVVSLAPSMTEALFAIGAGALVVGRSRFCDFPPDARALPVVGDVDPDLEAILELRPSLVVGLSALSSERLAERLRSRQIANWFPDTSSLRAIDAVILGLGERLGHARDARLVVERLDARERAIANAVAGEPRPRVLMVVSLSPVVAAGPKSFADELIRAAGGENAVSEGGAWPTVGFEKIAYVDPDVVLDATLVDSDRPTRITPESAGWSGIGAVRRGQVVAIRDERILRAGPRIAEGLAGLARALHPGVAVP